MTDEIVSNVEALTAADGRMPRPLLRYWTRGEGAAKLRLGTKGSFRRCVRQFRKYGVRSPEGTCANLYHHATGRWPGRHKRRGVRATLTAAVEYTGAMIALVPAEADARRLYRPGGIPVDELHLTLVYLGEATGFDADERENIIDLVEEYVDGLDPVDGNVFAVSMFNPKGDPVTVLGVGGDDITMVRETVLEAVEDAEIDVDDQHDPFAAHITVRSGPVADSEELAGLAELTGPVVFDRVRISFGGDVYDIPLDGNEPFDIESMIAAVNPTGWRKLPVAERGTDFNADDAIARITQWANGDVAKFSQMFLWHHPQAKDMNPEFYRLPIADIINGKPMLIPRAVFSAGTILSGGHGALKGTVEKAEIKRLKGIVSQMYDDLRGQYGDPRVVAPWERGGNDREDVTAAIVASVNSSGWSTMPLADEGRRWDSDPAKARVWEWAGGDFRKYRRAFLWYDALKPELKQSYKLPVADIIDGELTIVPRAVNAVAQVLGGSRGGVDIPAEDMDRVQAVVKTIQKRWQEAVTAAAPPVAPPREWFTDPALPGPTPIVVTADGRVYGHAAAWNVCHAGIGNECVMAPHSATGYRYFCNGSVLTADGSTVNVGKITLGTGHASTRLGWIPAADHYDNTGTAIAVVAAGEDNHGIWVAGSVVPGTSEEKIAELRRSPISGDWRRINGNLELVAALAVNTPGFPVLARTASGEPDTVIAAGVVDLDGSIVAATPHDNITEDDKNLLSRLAAVETKAAKIIDDGRSRRKAALLARIGDNDGMC